MPNKITIKCIELNSCAGCRRRANEIFSAQKQHTNHDKLSVWCYSHNKVGKRTHVFSLPLSHSVAGKTIALDAGTRIKSRSDVIPHNFLFRSFFLRV